MTNQAKSDLCEDLVNLYLRLNGFFTSGFVVHAPFGQGNISEVDVLAVRFPLYQEQEREFEIHGDPLLQLSRNQIEFAICEVKTGKPRIQCNPALRKSADGLSRILRRVGMFDPDEVKRLVPETMKALQPTTRPEKIVTIEANDKIRIRFYFFAPDLDKPRNNQAFFIGGGSTISFISQCLSMREKRASCATNYGAGQWGRIAPLVDFFKKWPTDNLPKMQNLYDDDLLQKFYADVGPLLKRRTKPNQNLPQHKE